jgi:protein SCO1
MNNKKTSILLVSFFIVLSTVFVLYFFNLTKNQKKRVLPIIGSEQNHHVAPFSFTNQDGKVITEKEVAGKIYVVSYFFATCKGICPKMNENMSTVYKAFRGNTNVLILSHTVYPKMDTVEALKAYSRRFDADAAQWMFLTGEKQKLYDMARYSYLISAEDDTSGLSIDKDFIHDKHYSLVDRHGRIRGFYDGLDKVSVDKLIGDINALLKEE